MNYKQLQAVLKQAKSEGLTTIELNSKQEVLQAEFERIFCKTADEDEYIGPHSELTCEVILSCSTALACPLPLASVKKVVPITNRCEDMAGGSNYTRPVYKGKVNAQVEQRIKGSDKKVKCEFSKSHKSESFINVNARRFTQGLGDTERKALDNVVSFGRAVKNFMIGFSEANKRRAA